MKHTDTLLAALLLAPLASFAAPERPNVLFICTDQQHAGMLSCAGNRWLKTPAMDSLAATGARFERAYSVNPVCVPSRTGMLTGYTPSRFGMQSNGELATTRIPDDIQRQTMGWLFRNAGYETAYGGKTHVPGKISDYGFDVLTTDQREELAAQCAAFLKKPHDKPFLLVASFINPHDICYMAINDFERSKTGKPKQSSKAPHQVCLAAALERPAGVSEAEFFAKYCPPAPANLEPQADAPEAVQQSLGGKAKTFRQHAFQNWSIEQWRLHRWAYCRLTERVDREIGQVLQALRAAGLEEKTLVVFTSDHGDMDGSHRLEHKSMFYEEATRVPFREHNDRPFFLAVGFLKPHLSFVAPKKYWDMYDPAKLPLARNPFPPKDCPPLALPPSIELRARSDIPKDGPIPDDLARRLLHGYLACVSYVDAQVGRLLDELEQNGLAGNTVVVFWGDHGWQLGEHSLWGKAANFETSARAPLIVSAPGRKGNGGQAPGLVEFVDVYPTLCELAGLPLPAHLEGVSTVPLLNDPARPGKTAAFTQHPCPALREWAGLPLDQDMSQTFRPLMGKIEKQLQAMDPDDFSQEKYDKHVTGYSIRTDRHRLVYWCDDHEPDKPVAVELYDHQDDPDENENVAGKPEHANTVITLRQQLKASLPAKSTR